jgi:hypothetical protein
MSPLYAVLRLGIWNCSTLASLYRGNVALADPTQAVWLVGKQCHCLESSTHNFGYVLTQHKGNTMNSIAHIVHALVTNNQQPAADLSAAEQTALAELRPLLQAAPQDLAGMNPQAKGWTLGATSDDERVA